MYGITGTPPSRKYLAFLILYIVKPKSGECHLHGNKFSLEGVMYILHVCVCHDVDNLYTNRFIAQSNRILDICY